MTKQEFLDHCLAVYGTVADYPFEGDFETAALRHAHNRKWYALVMRVPLARFGIDGGGRADVVNLKIPTEHFGEFDAFWGVFPAYHMNKRHWVSVLLSEAPDDLLCHLTSLSFDATHTKK